MRVALTVILVGVLIGVGLPDADARAGQESKRPSLVIPSTSGRDLFRFYCAPCHGPEGKGAGPVASALTVKPPDLTTIARRAGGTFNRERVERHVSGADAPPAAHGSREMPVWGPVFRSLDPSDAMTRVRLANLVTFLESIQAK